MNGRRAALVALFVAACGPVLTGPPPSPPPRGAVIVAASIAFDRQELDVRAGGSFALLLQNRDAIPHNLTIVGPDGAPVFVGEIFSGPGSRAYEVPALAPGRYPFRCDVHPLSMIGEVVAAP